MVSYVVSYEENMPTPKERRSAANDKYYKSHRLILISLAREKIPCECGKLINRAGMSSHRKTAKHAAWASSRQIEPV